jgi:hypothetical protein
MDDLVVDGAIEAHDRSAVAALADPSRWSRGASELLADLGFTLIHSDRPWVGDGSHLLVALRAHPTERHFDPESIALWVAASGRGRPTIVERRTLGKAPRSVLWGHVHVVDRLEIENRFLSFGGELRVAEIEPDLAVVDLRSPGPVVRWGGHSQGEDPLAGEIGAFFGRLIVPIDYRPGAEALVSEASPLALYAAFLADAEERVHRTIRRLERGSIDALGRWVDAEAARIRKSAADEWSAGQRLLDELGLRV